MLFARSSRLLPICLFVLMLAMVACQAGAPTPALDGAGTAAATAAPSIAAQTRPPEATSASPAADPAGAPAATAAVAALATLPPPVISVTADAATGPAPALEPSATGLPPQASPAPAVQRLGPESIPYSVNPLTGEQVANPALLDHRPIAVKVSNSGPVVRPQSGLSDAAIVFEHYAEGGITRYTAVFYGQDTPLVGPVRSARLIDLEIPKMFDAAFGYSGSSGPVQEMMRAGPFFERVISPDFGHAGFWRDYEIGNPDKPAWETMYTDTDTLRQQLLRRDEDRRPELPANWLFDAALPGDAKPATTIEVGYQATNVFWRYDANTGQYLRWADGAQHLDANDGSQLAFRNVVAVAANHVETLILEDEVAGGHYGIEIQLWGEGPASIFRDGLRIDGRWLRTAPGDMLTFHDSAGNLIPLAPGNTFIQVVPLGFANLWTTP
jgi:hypothetical protein